MATGTWEDKAKESLVWAGAGKPGGGQQALLPLPRTARAELTGEVEVAHPAV